MNLKELKELLEAGKITQEQFDALVSSLNLSNQEEDKDKDKNKKNEKQKDKGNEEDDIDEMSEKIIQRAVDRATNKLGNENKSLREQLEKLKKEKLTAEELQKLEAEEKEKSLAERELAVKEAENKLYAIKAIKKAGLDDGSENALEILSLVSGEDEDTIDENIKALKQIVDKLVKAEVEKTFRQNGRTPDKGGKQDDIDNPYAEKTFNLTKQMELERTNPELAKKYKLAASN